MNHSFPNSQFAIDRNTKMPQFPQKSTTETFASETWLPKVTLAEIALLPGITTPIQTKDRQTRTVFRKVYRERKEIVIAPQNSAGMFSDIGCLCQMTSWSGANAQDPIVILRGLKRVRISAINETEATAKIETASDDYPANTQNDRQDRRAELLDAFFLRFPEQVGNQTVRPLLERDLPFGTLCDLLSFSCQLNADEYISILGELDVDQRCDIVLEMLMDSNRNFGEIEFPPAFSWN